MAGRSRTAAVALVVGVLATTSGCGFLDTLAHPEAQQAAATGGSGGAEPVVGAAAATSPAAGPRTIAQGQLLARGEGVGTVQVVTEPVRTGLTLPFPSFHQDCPVDTTAMQFVAVDVSFTLQPSGGGLAGHLTVTPGPSTPADIGDVGVFFEPAADDEYYCTDYPPLPTTDTFWARGTRAVTGYVVLDQAVGPATPQGRADVFPSLQAQLSDLRIRDDRGRETPLTLGPLSVGGACPDDAGAVCVPLG